MVHQNFAAVDGQVHGAATCIGNNGATNDHWLLETFQTLATIRPVTSGEFGLTVNELWPAEGNTALRLSRLSFWCRLTGPVVGTGCHLERQLRFLPFFGLTRLTQTCFFSLAIGQAAMVQDLHKDALVCWRVGHPLIHSVVKHQVKFWCILKGKKTKIEKC